MPGKIKKIEPRQIVEAQIYTREQHCISRKDIDPDALKILYRLLQHRYKAFLVGGGVRDLLLQKEPKDFDISTDATPRRIKDVFRNSRIIGRRFKLVHVFFQGNKIIEVSTFRDFTDPENEEDYHESGANLSVRDNKFGTEETDALRRDITINGLFYDLSNFSVIDYVGGLRDLQDGIIRVIGDPDQRFPEDPVRMMRVVRHAVRAGFSIEPVTWESLLQHRNLLCEVPPMRVYEELKKDLLGGRSLEMLRVLQKSRLLELLLPSVAAAPEATLSNRSRLAHTLEHIDSMIIADQQEPAISVTLATLAYFSVGEELLFAEGEVIQDLVNNFFSELAVPKKEKERISHILIDWERLKEADLAKVKPAQFARRAHLQELIMFIEAIAPEREDLIALLKGVRNQNVHQLSDERKRIRSNRQRQSIEQKKPRIRS
jgi:poly(A) polymerase